MSRPTGDKRPIRFQVHFVFAIIMVCAIAIAFLVNSSVSAKEPASIPYKATTIDECIQEKECVWYAFDLLVNQDFQNYVPGDVLNAEGIEKTRKEKRKHWRLVRWGKPPIIAVIGNGADEYKEDIQKVVQKIQPNFPLDIKIQNDYLNIILLISDDVNREFYGRYYKELKKILNVLIERVENKMGKKTVCVFVPMGNKSKTTELSIILVDSDKKFRDKCIESSIYGSLTYPYKILDLPDTKTNQVTNMSFVQQALMMPEISDLDLLLMRIIQSPYLKPGMTFEEVEAVFEKAYMENR